MDKSEIPKRGAPTRFRDSRVSDPIYTQFPELRYRETLAQFIDSTEAPHDLSALLHLYLHGYVPGTVDIIWDGEVVPASIVSFDPNALLPYEVLTRRGSSCRREAREIWLRAQETGVHRSCGDREVFRVRGSNHFYIYLYIYGSRHFYLYLDSDLTPLFLSAPIYADPYSTQLEFWADDGVLRVRLPRDWKSTWKMDGIPLGTVWRNVPEGATFSGPIEFKYLGSQLDLPAEKSDVHPERPDPSPGHGVSGPENEAQEDWSALVSRRKEAEQALKRIEAELEKKELDAEDVVQAHRDSIADWILQHAEETELYHMFLRPIADDIRAGTYPMK